MAPDCSRWLQMASDDSKSKQENDLLNVLSFIDSSVEKEKITKIVVFTDNLIINLEDLPLALEITAGVIVLILFSSANF